MRFRIHRMKEPARDHFLLLPHTSGKAICKPKDYEPAGEIEAMNLYAAWSGLRQSEHPVQTGDVLESENGSLFIAKYIGFEPAEWWVPEPKPVLSEAEAVGSQSQASG